MKIKKIWSMYLTIVLVLGLCACGQSAEAAWQEQYDLGVKYLSEGNYEEAIIAFTAAIEIDPKRSEAYGKAAEAYVGLGDLESAAGILAQGYEATGDSGLAEQLAQLEAGSDGGQADDQAWTYYEEGLEAYFAGDHGQALEKLDAAIAAGEENARDLALFAGAAARTAYAMGDTETMLCYFAIAEAHMELGPPYYNDGLFDEWGGINVTHPMTDEGEAAGVIYTLLGPGEDGADPEVLTQFQFDANGEPVVYGE